MKNDIDINKLEMREVYLTCPVKSEDLVTLKLGDQVYLSGVIFTGREGLYQRLIEQNLELPVPVTEISNVNFQCSPAATPAAEIFHIKISSFHLLFHCKVQINCCLRCHFQQ